MIIANIHWRTEKFLFQKPLGKFQEESTTMQCRVIGILISSNERHHPFPFENDNDIEKYIDELKNDGGQLQSNRASMGDRHLSLN